MLVTGYKLIPRNTPFTDSKFHGCLRARKGIFSLLPLAPSLECFYWLKAACRNSPLWCKLSSRPWCCEISRDYSLGHCLKLLASDLLTLIYTRDLRWCVWLEARKKGRRRKNREKEKNQSEEVKRVLYCNFSIRSVWLARRGRTRREEERNPAGVYLVVTHFEYKFIRITSNCWLCCLSGMFSKLCMFYANFSKLEDCSVINKWMFKRLSSKLLEFMIFEYFLENLFWNILQIIKLWKARFLEYSERFYIKYLFRLSQKLHIFLKAFPKSFWKHFIMFHKTPKKTCVPKVNHIPNDCWLWIAH